MSMSDPCRTWPVQTLPISRGRNRRELAHQAEGLDAACRWRFLEPLGTLVDPGHRLDLVADLGVAGQVAGPEPVLDPQLAGGLSLGGEVLRFFPGVHHPRRQEGDLTPNPNVSHAVVLAAVIKPGERGSRRCGRGRVDGGNLLSGSCPPPVESGPTEVPHDAARRADRSAPARRPSHGHAGGADRSRLPSGGSR